ncbi:MAG TPA: XRE family transcriptional regulator [Nitrospirae bacterium]|nr:XRE family transcriptional regulator [Nitrospirota bacterium]
MWKFNPDKIKEIRKANGLSQEAFAVKIGNKAKRQHVCHWEKKQSRPSLASLLAIVNAFRVPLDFFFTYNLHHSNNLFSTEGLTQ